MKDEAKKVQSSAESSEKDDERSATINGKESTPSRAATESEGESSEGSDRKENPHSEQDETEAIPYAEKPPSTAWIEDSTPSGPLLMRWRSPGNSAGPGSCTEEEDGSPQSISLSVSEVQTSVFVEMRLGNLTQPETESTARNLPVHPVIPRRCAIEHGKQASSLPVHPVTTIRQVGKGLSKSGRSSITPKPAIKIIAKREPKKEEVKSERAKEEVVDSVFTRVRTDTPTNDRSEGPPNPVAETAIT